jgi:hypothetical protein
MAFIMAIFFVVRMVLLFVVRVVLLFVAEAVAAVPVSAPPPVMSPVAAECVFRERFLASFR